MEKEAGVRLPNTPLEAGSSLVVLLLNPASLFFVLC